MKRLLARENLELLAQLAWSKVLLGFDFDGTLAPIVDDRDAAVMRDSTAKLFATLTTLYPCAVISGRAKRDVVSRLGGAPVKYIIGNHGLEPGAELGEFEREIARTRPLLASALDAQQGVEIEDKRFSLAVHYRKSRQKRAARAAIEAALSTVPIPMRVVPGKLVVNIVPARAPNKGQALLDLREREGANVAFYIGDDVTDEDVFELDQPGRLFTVRVGESRSSAAKHFLRSQREIDALLLKLVNLRKSVPRHA